jgi:condensin complex subunit 3
MREKLLRWGLNDRDESVRQAAKKMFNYRWVDDVGGDLLEVLERLDVTREPNEGGFICLAMKGFWENRKDVLEDLTFDDGFWENLTPEGSFLARTFNDYCRNASPQETKGVEIDELMPEVTRLAFYLQKYINKLVAMVQSENMGEATDLEFIVQQLLLISMTMDYGDEIGRRKMFALFRESLGIVQLPEPVTKLIVEGLKMLTTSEGDFSMLRYTTRLPRMKTRVMERIVSTPPRVILRKKIWRTPLLYAPRHGQHLENSRSRRSRSSIMVRDKERRMKMILKMTTSK